MGKYAEAILRPFSDWKKLGIGFLLYLIPIVNIITGLFAQGYLVECARSSMKKKKKLPEWTKWGDLFVKGLLVLAISLLYAIPTIVMIMILGLKIGFYMVEKGLNPETVNVLSLISENFLPLTIATIVIFLITIYLMPMILMMFAKNYKFKDAFKLVKIVPKIFTWKYLGMFLFLLIYGITVTAVLKLIPTLIGEQRILPFVVDAFSKIFVSITSFTLYGIIFTELTKN